MSGDLSLFNYAGAGIPADAASRLEFYAARVEAGHQNAVTAMMQTAEALAKARDEFPSNQGFGEWRGARLPWLSSGMASQYLNVWTQYGDAVLDPGQGRLFQTSTTVLRLLAQPAADDIRDAVEARIAAGEDVTKAEIERLKREAREARDAADRAQRDLLDLQSLSVEKAQKASNREANLIAARNDLQQQLAMAQRDAERKLEEAEEEARAVAEAQFAERIADAEREARQAKEALEAAEAQAQEAAAREAEAIVERTLAERRAELEEIERKRRVAQEAAERHHQAEQTLRKEIEEHRAYLAKTQAAEHEWPEHEKVMRGLVSALNSAMLDMSGFDFAPNARGARLASEAAQFCDQMATALRAFADRQQDGTGTAPVLPVAA
jgi:hypothetical protein